MLVLAYRQATRLQISADGVVVSLRDRGIAQARFADVGMIQINDESFHWSSLEHSCPRTDHYQRTVVNVLSINIDRY